MKKIVEFFTKEKNIVQASYVWNMVGSMLNALQSVYFLMIITRVLGLKEAGIFSIAYANANLFLNIGKYGIRYFQVSDYRNQFSFVQYVKVRHLTTFAMGFVSVIYVLISGYVYSYSKYKGAVILWMCLWKVTDALEDVYHGDLQKNGRLDIAGKLLCARVISMSVIWTILIVLIKNQVIVTATVAIYTFVFCSITIYVVKDFFSQAISSEKSERDYEKRIKDSVKIILRDAFPLFLSSFLAFYIGNAPKYAIDSQLSDQMQACYGFIAMPVFVIGLLNSFIFNPIVTKMSLLWNQRKTKKFIIASLHQMVDRLQ